MPKIDYAETSRNLRIRINAHTAWANFKLEDWLLNRLGASAGSRLLEIGCGDGNFFKTFAESVGAGGLIVGLDLNKGLLRKARANSRHILTPVCLFQWNFDVHPYPLADEDIDIIVSLFSAYYANDVSAWIDDSLRVLKKGGRMLILGPTKDNAGELYRLNEVVTGIKSVYETEETSKKITDSFLPELKKREVKVRKTVLERRIIFPSAREFTRYYFATLLYEKTRERIKKPITFDRVLRIAQKMNCELNKEVVCLEALK